MSSMTHIIGVDPGITTGICTVRIYPDHTWSLLSRTQVKGVDGGTGLWDLYYAVRGAIIDAKNVMGVSMEELLSYTNSAQEKAEAQAAVRMAASALHLSLYTYSPTTIRAMVVGHGRAKESDVRKITRKLIGAPEHPKKGEGFPNHQQDALAAALCCALSHDLLLKVAPCVPLRSIKQPVRRCDHVDHL